MAQRVPPGVVQFTALSAIVLAIGCWFSLKKHRAPQVPHPSAVRRAVVGATPSAHHAPALHAAASTPRRIRLEEEEGQGDHPFDEPLEALEFYAARRMPYGAATLPMERYFTAAVQNSTMPQFSSSLGVALPPSSQATPNNTSVSTWTSLGPGNIGGRVRALLIDPTNPSTMYTAGVAGGVWKTTNSGGTWTAVGGLLPNLAVNSMAMDPSNSSTIYAGTGEGYMNIDSVRGAGIFVTNDGGATWSVLGATGSDPDFYYVNKLAVSPVSSSRVYAATETGVFQSTDSGATWNQILSSSSNNGCFDLALRTDQTTDYILASCGTFAQAYLWRNTAADSSPTNWTQVFTAGSNMGLTSLAISPSNQNRIYALASTTASGKFQNGLLSVFSSADGGATWSAAYTNTGSTTTLANMLLTNGVAAACGSNTLLNQGWYDNVIAVDPTSPPAGPDIVWIGGIDLYRSNNSGQTWGEASYWWTSGSSYSHADQHAIVFLPTDDGKTMFIGSDGGVSWTTNRLASVGTSLCSPNTSVSFTNLNHNLGITQFYDGAVYPNGATFFGGTQDNGTNAGTVAGGANGWTQLLGGDGGFVAVDPANTNILYGEYTGLSIVKSTDGGISWSTVTTGISDSGFLFIAPFTMDPNNPQQLWTGGTYIWTTSNGASSWTKAGSGLNGAVTAIAVATGNSNQVAVGASTGEVYYTTNALSASPTWSVATPRANAYVSTVAYDPNNSSILYATYSTFKYLASDNHVYQSTNGGSTWAGIDGSGATGIPDTPVISIVVNPSNSQMLFIGTDSGVYSSTAGGNIWNVETTGFGNAPIDSLSLLNVSGSNYLYAFTHGYGVWSAPVVTAGTCSYTLSQNQSMPAAGGSGTVTVTTQSVCSWSAVSNNTTWLNVTGGAAGTGTGSFSWSAATNSGASRSGTITVSGEGASATFTVTQAAATYSISGQVTSGGNPLSGVTVTLSGSNSGSTTTSASGDYSFTESAGGTYTVTPSLTGYTFTPGSLTETNLASNATANFTATTPNNITIATSPAGLSVVVDGVALTAPASLYWAPGSTGHTLSVASPQAGPSGTQYVWQSWSDNGAQSHSVSAPASGVATFTATFATEYLLTEVISPSGAGSITANPSSPSGYYNSGASVQLTAASSTGFVFTGWSVGLSGSTNPQSVVMNAPVSVTANFNPTTPVTVTTSPAGLSVTVDGVTYPSSPQSFTWATGSTHSIGALSPQGSGGVSYVFNNWSDGGTLAHNITVPVSSVVYTALFNALYQLTTTASPAAGGAISVSPASPDGYYSSGTPVSLTATPSAGYSFTGWSGALSGTANPQSVSMTAAVAVSANFALAPCSFTFSPPSASLPATGTSTVETCPNNSGQPNCGVTPEIPQAVTVTPSAACGAWTATSSNPAVLTITSAGAASGPGSIAFTLLNNTHTTPQTYAITVASESASVAYAVTEAGSGDSQTYREVYALYEQLLGRDPDPGGFAFWSGSGGAGLGQMADSFLTSPEAYNTDFAVMAAYQAATGAPPTYAQFTAAVTNLRAGAQTVTGLFNSLLGSGYTAATLYQNLLNRSPSASEVMSANAAGLAQWFQTLIGYPAAATPVGSPNNEFQSTGTYHTTLAADHSNSLYIQMLYYVILGRDPDPSGLAFWVGIANTGGPGVLFEGSAGYPTRIQILGPGAPNQGFIGSSEFQGLFAN